MNSMRTAPSFTPRHLLSGLLLSLLVPTLVGCTPAAKQPSDKPDTGPSPHQANTPSLNAADIVGEWRIASVNGKDIDQSTGITASISDNEIRVNAGCVNMAFTYRLLAGRFASETTPVASCARPLSPAEKAVGDALTTAQNAARDSSNALVLSGAGNSLSLYTQ